MVIDVIT